MNNINRHWRTDLSINRRWDKLIDQKISRQSVNCRHPYYASYWLWHWSLPVPLIRKDGVLGTEGRFFSFLLRYLELWEVSRWYKVMVRVWCWNITYNSMPDLLFGFHSSSAVLEQIEQKKQHTKRNWNFWTQYGLQSLCRDIVTLVEEGASPSRA